MITDKKLNEFHDKTCTKCKNKNTDLCEIRERIDGTLNCTNEETDV